MIHQNRNILTTDQPETNLDRGTDQLRPGMPTPSAAPGGRGQRRIRISSTDAADDVNDTPWGDRLQVRLAHAQRDSESIRRLYATGLLGGAISPNDTAADLDHLDRAYFSDAGRSGFWVAELTRLTDDEIEAITGQASDCIRASRAGCAATNGPATKADLADIQAEVGRLEAELRRTRAFIIGTIGFQCVEDHVGEFRRLRVHRLFRQRGVGTRLVKTALRHARSEDFLKVILNSNVQQLPAMSLFQRFGFQLSRTRQLHGKEVHEFYLNLYTDQPVSDDGEIEPDEDLSAAASGRRADAPAEASSASPHPDVTIVHHAVRPTEPLDVTAEITTVPDDPGVVVTKAASVDPMRRAGGPGPLAPRTGPSADRA